MKRLQCLMILHLIISVISIKVPVAPIENATETTLDDRDDITKETPVYYSSDETGVDSYLVPPNPYQAEVSESSDVIATPATYLLPPLPNLQSDYYIPTEPATQSEWYPIVQALPNTKANKFLNKPKVNSEPGIQLPIQIGAESFVNPEQYSLPSRQLEPPIDHAQNNFYLPLPQSELDLPQAEIRHQFTGTPATELQLPVLEQRQKFKSNANKIAFTLAPNPIEPTLALHLTPPKPIIFNKNPTNLYPKKYGGGFKPILIPISEFTEGDIEEIPKEKPLKAFKPALTSDALYLTPESEKKIFLAEQVQLKRKLKEDDESKKRQIINSSVEGADIPEQEMSETSFHRPTPNRVPARRRPGPEPQQQAPRDRTEFRMHGMKGPHSYQFGYDTGKGKNRQFRYEERDNDGHVRGHYGYMDRHGKLRVVNYDADPEHGFRADTGAAAAVGAGDA